MSADTFDIVFESISALYVLMITVTVVTLVVDKRDPVKTLSWVVVITMLPVAGILLYVMFGQNFRKRKIFKDKNRFNSDHIDSIITRQLYSVNSPFADNRPEIAVNRDVVTLLLNAGRSPVTYNNDIRILNDGRETFEAIFTDIAAAKSSIHVEYYIISDDSLGRALADLLCQKASEGVEVRVIYDSVGSFSLPRRYIERLKSAGVEVEEFMPVVFPHFTSKINYRNHRKIVVIDGAVSFTGGLNVADRYVTGTSKLGDWRDTHLRIEGKASHTLQAIFITDWHFVHHVQLDEALYFAKTEPKEGVAVQIASSGPDSDWAAIMQGYFSAITKARNHIYISTPYFLPNEALLTAIKVASLGGVDVRLMLPFRSDSKTVYWATRSYITELMEAGVSVYLYYGGFNHSKLLMIDSMLSSIGSANMDIRSFEDNFEVSALIYDSSKTVELENRFLADLEQATLIRPSDWEARPVRHRFYEALARLLSPLL